MFQFDIKRTPVLVIISRYSICTGIDITAPSPQQLIYQSNGMIECSSVNNTNPVWHTVNPNRPIMNDSTYSIGQRGLSITNVQLYHQQQYKCEHLLLADHVGRSVIIDVKVLGKYIRVVSIIVMYFIDVTNIYSS